YVGLAEKVLKTAPKDYLPLAWSGLGLYRAGQFEAAAERLNQARSIHGEGGTGWDMFMLSLVNYRLGKDEDARKWFAQGLAWLDMAREGKLKDRIFGNSLSWNQQLELQLLRGEVEAMALGTSGIK